MDLTIGSPREEEVGSVVVLIYQLLSMQFWSRGTHIAERKLKVLQKKTYGTVGAFNEGQWRPYW